MLGEKLKEALDNQVVNLDTLVWKGKKVRTRDGFVQEEIKLVDASRIQLFEFAEYCQTMLHNKDKQNPGRYIVLATIKDQAIKCNTELFLRNMEERGASRYTLLEQIKNILSENKCTSEGLTLANVSNACPDEFKNIPLQSIIDGCQDKLGAFNKKHLTTTFILKMGVWLTNQELIELVERDENGKPRNRMDVIRERLGINANVMFNINSAGLSYAQLRAAMQLKNKKYSELTTDQLIVLRNRILPSLEAKTQVHIAQWEERAKQINKVIANK